ncbi:beta strand repeat-containing protein [Paraburkholderia sp. BR10923]|uniref:beta strand repeat-containing protein n=1 Tax=Paraburkholderia sp. BR10923 TaxID=3236992 RepID=UPI0034D01EE2
MAAAQYYEEVQQAYLAYYGRPADPAGQEYWAMRLDNAGGNLSSIINEFGTSTESTALYGGSNLAAQITAIYQTLFGRAPDAEGLNFYQHGINTGEFTLASVALNIYYGATGTDKAQLDAKQAYADAFTNALSASVSAQIAYSGKTASDNARAAVAAVTDTASEGTAAAHLESTLANINAGAVGQTVTLTTGVDTITLTGNNNVVNATPNSTGLNTLTSLDSISGTGTGNTLNIVDGHAAGAGYQYTIPTAANIGDIATLNVTTNGGVSINTGSSNVAAPTETSIAGLTALNVTAADSANAAVVGAADTTNVTLTTGTAGAATIYGGAVDTVTATAATTVQVIGAGLTAVTVNGDAGAVTIDNQSAAGATGAGTTLTSATINGNTALANTAAIKGMDIAAVTLENFTNTDTVTITNGTTGSQSLTLNVSNVGFAADGTQALTTVIDSTVTNLTVDATGKNDVVLTAADATALTITGSGSLVIDATSTFGTLKTIDASANSGGVTLTDGVAAANVTGGSGNDVVTLGVANVTGTINLGAGNNTLLAGSGSLSNTAVVNGGTGGVNTISASLVNAGDAANISNFQVLDVSGFGNGAGNGSLDASLMTGSTVSGVSISSAITSGVATLLNLGANVTVTDTLDAAAVVGSNDLVLSHAGGSGTLTVDFADSLKAHTNGVNIDSLQSTGDTSIALSSAGVKGAVNSLTGLTETDNHLTTITITGSNAFTLGGVTTDSGIAAAASATKTASLLTLIDGSQATGALTITAGANGTPSANNTITYTGLTIKGGIGGDTIANDASNGVIIEGATASTHTNHLTLGAIGTTATGGSINDAASAGADVLTLNNASSSATLGSGTGVTVTVNDVAATHNVADAVTFGSGTATVTDKLTYQEVASATSASTAGNMLTLNGTLHGETLSFGNAVAAGTTLGAATSVAAAQTFDQAVFAAAGTGAGAVTWFQYAGNTYIEDVAAAATTTTANVVKITGLVDLSHTAITAGAAGVGHITFA